MPRISNPYGVQTPLGASMGGLARLALASRGRAAGPDKTDLYDAQAGMYDAHAGVYDETARKLAEERAARERTNYLSSDAGINETLALGYGVPVANINALGDYVHGRVPMPPALPGGVNHADVGRRLHAIRTGIMDGRSTAQDIARAEAALAEEEARRAVMSGTASPTRLRQAYGTGPVFSQNAQGSVMNTVEGGPLDQSSPLAVASIASERAQANQRNAAAGASGALARQRDLETRTGIRLGAPVLVDDPEVGLTYTSPLSAPGRAPAAKPTDRPERLVPVRLPDGRVVYRPQSEAVDGEVPPKAVSNPKPAQVRGLTSAQAKALEAAVDEQYPGLDKPDRQAIISRATAEATNPASPTYQNPAGSVGAVMQGVEIDERTFGKNRLRDRAGFATGRLTPPPAAAVPPRAAAPAPAPAPSLAGQKAPGVIPPPDQREVNGVYQTPRGAMRWTGTGWVPAVGR